MQKTFVSPITVELSFSPLKLLRICYYGLSPCVALSRAYGMNHTVHTAGGIFDLDPSPTRGEGIDFKRDYWFPINGGAIFFTIKVVVKLLFVLREGRVRYQNGSRLTMNGVLS
jgi:hypothetical protein